MTPQRCLALGCCLAAALLAMPVLWKAHLLHQLDGRIRSLRPGDSYGTIIRKAGAPVADVRSAPDFEAATRLYTRGSSKHASCDHRKLLYRISGGDDLSIACLEKGRLHSVTKR